MAYFSNSLVGIPQVGADVNVYAIDASQKFALGTAFTRADGARFAYGYSSAGVTKGRVVASTFATASFTLDSNHIIAPASATAVAGDTMKPGAIGSRYIQATIASITANQLAGGYMVALGGTGFGQTFRIKGNTATGNPVSGDFRMEFYEPITVAFDATTDFVVIGCPFNDVIVADGTNYVVAGVSVSTTTAAKPYGWFLTKGITAVLEDNTTAAPVAGKGVQLSPAVAGAIALYGNASTDVATLKGLRCIGLCCGISIDTGYAVVDFNL